MIAGRSFTSSAAGTSLSYSVNYAEFPFLVRVTLGKGFSVFIGGFYGAPNDSYTVSNGSKSLSLGYTKAGLKGSDYGVTAGIGYLVPLGKSRFNLFADVQYNLGLTNQSSGSSSLKMSEVQMMAGFALDFQTKR